MKQLSWLEEEEPIDEEDLSMLSKWEPREFMPGDVSYILIYPEHGLYACVGPLHGGVYSYFVARRNADGSRIRMKHWLETGKKHKVSLEEGKRICEEAITIYLSRREVTAI